MHIQSGLNGTQLAPRTLRRYARHLYSVPIKLRRVNQAGKRVSHGVTLDISEGGFGAVIEESLRTGETVRIDLPLPHTILEAEALVRYSGSSRSGFEFQNLNAETRQQIVAAAELQPF